MAGTAARPIGERMNDGPPVSVDLGGDGDEIAAVQDVERTFGVQLDYADASSWITAGDVFSSLEETLSRKGAKEQDAWRRFAACLARQTGIDAALIQPESPLLSQDSLWARVADISACFWIAAALILAAIAALLFT